MYALFEEAGKFLAGRVMTEADSSAQIELDSGKRVKVKAANVLLRFEQPAPAELIASAQALAEEIDLDLAWEFAPDSRVRLRRPGARLLRAERRRREAGRGAVPAVRGAALLPPARQGQLQEGARGDRQGRPARHRTQEAARRADRRLGEPSWSAAPARSRCASSSTRSCSSRTATRPSTRPWSRRRNRSQRAPLDLLKAAGAIDSPYQFHWRRFLFEQFPKGTAFPRAAGARRSRRRCRSRRSQAFSIDDSATTEIDDALSVQGLGSGSVVFGIHIAAPALAFAPELAARQGRARAAVDRLHAGLEAHDAARRRWSRPTR